MKICKAIFNIYNPVRGLFQKECTIEAEKNALQALKRCNEIENRCSMFFFVSLEEV